MFYIGKMFVQKNMTGFIFVIFQNIKGEILDLSAAYSYPKNVGDALPLQK